MKICYVELLSFGCKLFVANWDFKLYTTYLVSPTFSTGYCRLKDRWFNPVCFVMVTFWLHIAWYLSNFKSNTCTLPSKVEAANTVLEYGAQAMSVTWESRSNIKRGLLKDFRYNLMNIQNGDINFKKNTSISTRITYTSLLTLNHNPKSSDATLQHMS